MKIASWNVAGIRARMPLLTQWIKENSFDIICLQETKIQDIDFPKTIFEDLGYHVSIFGQKSFNGVALLSKKTPDTVKKVVLYDEANPQARFIEATFSYDKGSYKVSSIYLPNGNPIDSPKYLYKLSWLENFFKYAFQQIKDEETIIFAGDFNILPQLEDAKNPEKWKNDALFQPDVRQFFFKLLNLGYVDALRIINIDPCYTFWDFQKSAFQKDDGIRIDHFLLSPLASNFLKFAYTQKDIRGSQKPSDHAPIVLELDINF